MTQKASNKRVKANNNDFKIKDQNLNTKVPLADYQELQEIADKLGMSLSSMVRTVLYAQLDKVRKSGHYRDFLDVNTR